MFKQIEKYIISIYYKTTGGRKTLLRILNKLTKIYFDFTFKERKLPYKTWLIILNKFMQSFNKYLSTLYSRLCSRYWGYSDRKRKMKNKTS